MLKAFDCQDFDDGTSYLRADYSISCNSARYTFIKARSSFLSRCTSTARTCRVCFRSKYPNAMTFLTPISLENVYEHVRPDSNMRKQNRMVIAIVPRHDKHATTSYTRAGRSEKMGTNFSPWRSESWEIVLLEVTRQLRANSRLPQECFRTFSALEDVFSLQEKPFPTVPSTIYDNSVP